jgi:hypothetical protein
MVECFTRAEKARLVTGLKSVHWYWLIGLIKGYATSVSARADGWIRGRKREEK